MTLRVKLEIAAAVLVSLAGAIGLFAYQAERENRIRAEATTQAQKDVQKQIAQQVSDLQKQMADRDSVYQQQLQQLDKRFQVATSPQQVAALFSQLLALPKPITVVTPQPTAENPHPEPVAQIPQIDFPQAKSYIQECENCKLQLPKLQADLADTKTKLDLQVKTTASVQKESDKWKITAEGGTWKQRAWHDGKLIAIGGAVAIVVACALGHCPK